MRTSFIISCIISFIFGFIISLFTFWLSGLELLARNNEVAFALFFSCLIGAFFVWGFNGFSILNGNYKK